MTFDFQEHAPCLETVWPVGSIAANTSDSNARDQQVQLGTEAMTGKRCPAAIGAEVAKSGLAPLEYLCYCVRRQFAFDSLTMP